MCGNGFRIESFGNLFRCRDKKGKRFFENRRWACFILTFSGKIEFSSAGGKVTAEAGRAVYLPKGLTYVNTCLEPADSIVLNFDSEYSEGVPLSLAGIPKDEALLLVEAVKEASALEKAEAELYILSKLYALAYRLFGGTGTGSDAEKVLHRLQRGYAEKLTVESLARECSMSAVTLEKRFCKTYGKTVYSKLTEIRMARARELLEEKRPIGEIAMAVGFEDVYRFSRAFKNYFGKAPSKYGKEPFGK